MTSLFVQNSKIKGSNTAEYLVYNFGIPAFKSADGTSTCPAAGACAKGCYANQGTYVWPVVRQAYENRLAATKSANFVDLVSAELDKLVNKAHKQHKQLVIRVHDSGDYYNPKYTVNWLTIFNKYNQVKFYSYTKQVKVFNKIKALGKLPSNFTVIYSEGGLFDRYINPVLDRHSRVFKTLDELRAANYVDATENDLEACFNVSNRIGLVYHGAKSKAWNTNVIPLFKGKVR